MTLPISLIIVYLFWKVVEIRTKPKPVKVKYSA
jgi:hypothetical protein